MRIIYLGNGPRGYKCLETLIDRGYNIVAVTGITPKQQMALAKDDLSVLANRINVPYYAPTSPNGDDFLNRIKNLKPDIAILSGYNKILKREFIELLPEERILNLHGGKLPEYRGAAPINWQIINGETSGEANIIILDEGIDTGPIVGSRKYNILPEDDAASILAKTLDIFPELLCQVLEKINAGTLKKKYQDNSKARYYSRRFPEDGQIDFRNMTAAKIHNTVRALVWPYPPAFCYLNGKKIFLLKTRLLKNIYISRQGRVVRRFRDGVSIMAFDRALDILTVAYDDMRPICSTKIFSKIYQMIDKC